MLHITRHRGAVFTAMFPFHSLFSYDVPGKSVLQIQETPMDRIKNIFVFQEYEPMSKELSSVINLTTVGTFVGAGLGGIIHTHGYIQKFIDENQATQYKTVTDAKRVLQDKFFLHFCKGAYKYGWRLGLFSGIFGLVTVICTAYRGRPSFLDYTCGGAVAGLLYRLSLGFKGALSGLIVGGSLGTFSGALIMLLLRLSGYSIDEILAAKKQWNVAKEEKAKEEIRKHIKDETMKLMETVQKERESLQKVMAEQLEKTNEEKNKSKSK